MKLHHIQIVVKLQLDGTHFWADCPIEEVAFLKDNHHHTFHFELKKEVSHSDRDIELLQFKRNVSDYLYNKYYQFEQRCLVFKGMSCEMIARELLEVFSCEEVGVFEDGTVGGVVTKEPNVAWPQIVMVFGYPCSGKNTFIKNHLPNHKHIVVSDIVKSLIKSNQTSELNDTQHLDKAIATHLRQQINIREDFYNSKSLVVDGIRQPSVLIELIEDLNRTKAFTYKLVWLDVSKGELQRRYQLRKRLTDDLTFEQVMAKNIALGLNVIEDMFFSDTQAHDNQLIIQN